MLFLFAGVAHASGAGTGCTNQFCPLANVSNSRLQDIYSGTDLANFISKLFTFAISIGAILAVLRLGWAGYLYMTTDSWGSKGKAKEVIGDVVLGLLLLLSIWIILKQINPDILKLNILNQIQKVDVSKQVPANTSGAGTGTGAGTGSATGTGGATGTAMPCTDALGNVIPC